MKRRKLIIIGENELSNRLAKCACLKNLGDVVSLAVNVDGKPEKGTLVSEEELPHTKTESNDLMTGADAVIVTIGYQMPGTPRCRRIRRDNLITTNLKLIEHTAHSVREYAPDAFVLCITNPLNPMVWAFQKFSGLPSHMVVGLADNAIDSFRLSFLLAEELKIAARDIQALIIGGTGDDMVPIIRHSSVGGISLTELVKIGLLPEEKLDLVLNQIRKTEPKLDITSSQQDEPVCCTLSEAALSLIESHFRDQKRLISCSCRLNGEYGVHDVYIGVPAVIGTKGVERVIELELDSREKVRFNKALAATKNIIGICREARPSLSS